MPSHDAFSPDEYQPRSRDGALRVVFIDASIYYVDERGEHSGLLSEAIDPQEDRCRLSTVSNNEQWLRAAVTLGNDLIDLARRSGDTNAWGCTSGRYGGANPGPNVMMKVIKSATGLRPPASATGPLTPPEDGRWSVRQVFAYDIGQHAPAVAIWHLGFTQNPNFFPLWCAAITSGETPPVLILPDSPIMRQSIQRWNEGERRRRGQTWRPADNLRDIKGSAAYLRTRVTSALDFDNTPIAGDRLVAAIRFLRARHQLRVSPFDLLQDSILASKLGSVDAEDDAWSPKEIAALASIRVRYERPQRVYKWLEEARKSPPVDVFSTGDSYPSSIDACLRTAERALATGKLAPVFISSWTGWAPSALDRGEEPEVPARAGTSGRLVDWYRRIFESAVNYELVDANWFGMRETWHAQAYHTFPGKPSAYYTHIYNAENALGIQPERRNFPVENEFSTWYRDVYTLAEELGLTGRDSTVEQES